MGLYRELFDRGRLALSLSILFCSMLVALDVLIVNTVLPQILKNLGGTSYYAWAIGIYSLGSFITIPIFSALLPKWGARPPMILAMAFFIFGATLGGCAHTMVGIVLGRFFQGLGAGGSISIPFGLIAQYYPPKLKPAAVGLVSAVWGASAVAGPLVGAALLKSMGWPSVFWFNIPSGLMILALSLFALRKDKPSHPKHPSMNLLGPLLFASTTALALEAAARPYPQNFLALAMAAVCAILFYWNEKNHPASILPLEAFRKRSALGVGILGMAFVTMSFGGVEAFLPLLLQGLWGISPLHAGLILTVGSMAWSGSSILAARWAARPRALGVSGNLFLVMGMILLLLILVNHPRQEFVYLGWFLAGLGIGQIVPVYNTLGLDLAENYPPGTTNGALLLALTWGFCVGPTLVGVFANWGLGKNFDPKNIGEGALPSSSFEALRQGGVMVLLACLLIAALSLANSLRLPSHRK